jgi:hypothetical protein
MTLRRVVSEVFARNIARLQQSGPLRDAHRRRIVHHQGVNYACNVKHRFSGVLLTPLVKLITAHVGANCFLRSVRATAVELRQRFSCQSGKSQCGDYDDRFGHFGCVIPVIVPRRKIKKVSLGGNFQN